MINDLPSGEFHYTRNCAFWENLFKFFSTYRMGPAVFDIHVFPCLINAVRSLRIASLLLCLAIVVKPLLFITQELCEACIEDYSNHLPHCVHFSELSPKVLLILS